MNPSTCTHSGTGRFNSAFFELLARETTYGVIMTDAERKIVWVNNAFTRTCGYTLEEIRGKNPSFLQGAKTDQKTVRSIRKALDGEKRVREKILNYTKLGDEYWVDLEIFPGWDRNGELEGFISVTRDISSNIELVESDQSRRGRKNALLETALDGVAILNPQGRILDVNPACCTMTGYSFKELSKMNILDLEPIERGEQIAAQLRTIFDLGRTGFHTRLKRKDGDLLDVQLSAQFDSLENTFILYIKDISERKYALDKIARLTTLYRALSECNEAILYSRSRQTLFEDICRIVVCHGNMKMAWVGKLDPSTGKVCPVAVYGEGKEYLENIKITANADEPEGRGPVGTAIREKRPFWCDDFVHDPMTAPWRKRAERFGWKTVACIPFSLESKQPEALVFYGGDELGFCDDVRDLLVRMVKNVTFALEKIDQQDAWRSSGI